MAVPEACVYSRVVPLEAGGAGAAGVHAAAVLAPLLVRRAAQLCADITPTVK